MQSLALSKHTVISMMTSPKDEGKIVATSAAPKKYDLTYYVKSALAGGICCSITHGSLCPVDVVKTRIQLDPVKFNKGLIGGFRTVIAEEGLIGLSTGLGATVVGYFIQGILYNYETHIAFDLFVHYYLSYFLFHSYMYN